MTRLGDWGRSMWADRPIIISAGYIRALEDDLRAAGWELPERRPRLERTRYALANLRRYLPVLTTAARMDRVRADQFLAGSDSVLAEWAMSTQPPSARKPIPFRAPIDAGQHASRVTATGRTLVAVDQ